MSAQEVIAALGLTPHPEKGYYVETFRDAVEPGPRAHSTCIYYLLEGESGLSHWHRVLDAVEIWHYYAGAPMQLSLSLDDGTPTRDFILGVDLAKVSAVPGCINDDLGIFSHLWLGATTSGYCST